MKNKLMALLKAKNERKVTINTQADKSTDVAELRGLNTELDALNAEIRSLQEMIDGLVDEPTNERTAAVNSEIPGVVIAGVEQRKAVDEEGMEYRKAFQQFATKGTPIPAELREDENTLLSDIPGALPTIMVNRIVEKLETTGMILPFG